MTETFEAFVRPYLLGDNARETARKLGMQHTTVIRQLAAETPIATVVKLCRVYSIPMLDAFVAAGFITEGEAEVIGRSRGIRQASERELVEEMMRRVASGEATAASTEPVEQHIVDESARFTGRGDVGGVEDAGGAHEAMAANTDDSAERLDPDLT